MFMFVCSLPTNTQKRKQTQTNANKRKIKLKRATPPFCAPLFAEAQDYKTTNRSNIQLRNQILCKGNFKPGADSTLRLLWFLVSQETLSLLPYNDWKISGSASGAGWLRSVRGWFALFRLSVPTVPQQFFTADRDQKRRIRKNHIKFLKTSGRPAVPGQAEMPFSVGSSRVNDRICLGHRPVEPCLFHRVSQGHPAGVP